MKHKAMIALILALCLLLPGCGSGSSPVRFYYPRSDYSYFASEQVMVAEERDISGYEGNLHYLLSLYLVGPLVEGLTTPFPQGTRLMTVEQKDSHVTINLSDLHGSVSDARFTLGCACMATTAMEAGGFQSATINSGERSLTLSAEDLLLTDDILPTEGTEETK